MRNYYMVRTRINSESFAKKSRVSVGWSEVNFSKYSRENDTIDLASLLYDVERTYYSDASNQIKGRKKGEISRFMNIKPNDVIVVPCYKGFYIGESEGKYEYDEESKKDDLSNQLKVKFKKDNNGNVMNFLRARKNTALVSKLGVRGFTILEIKEPELRREIDGLLNATDDISMESRVIDKEREELERFKESLAKTLPDYKKQSLQAGGTGFEHLVAALFESDGFSTQILSKKCGTGNADADILARKSSSLGDEFSQNYFIQVKHHNGITSSRGINQIVSFKENIENGKELIVSCESDNIRYVLISSGEFCSEDVNMAEKNNILLIDGTRLSEMLFEKIDHLDDYRYQLGYVKKFVHID